MAIEASQPNTGVSHATPHGRRLDHAKSGAHANLTDSALPTGFLELLSSMQDDDKSLPANDLTSDLKLDRPVVQLEPRAVDQSDVAPTINAPLISASAVTPTIVASVWGRQQPSTVQSQAIDPPLARGINDERKALNHNSIHSLQNDAALGKISVAEGGAVDAQSFKATASVAMDPAGPPVAKVSNAAHAPGSPVAPTPSAPVSAPRPVAAHWSKTGDINARGINVGVEQLPRDAKTQASPTVLVQTGSADQIAAQRPELATMVLFGGDRNLRSFSEDKGKAEKSEQTFGTPNVDSNTQQDTDDKTPADTLALDGLSEGNSPKYWLNPESRHTAELKVDELAGGSVDISIQLQGKEAVVAFKADGQLAQDALLSGGRQLENLMNDGGLVLSGLTVGQSGVDQQNSPSEHPSRDDAQRSGKLGKSAAISASPQMESTTRRSDGLVDHFV